MAMAGNQRSVRSVRQTANRTTGASGAWWFTSTSGECGLPASIADGSRHGFTTRGNGMLIRLQLSSEHVSWLENVRKIPSELAAEMGVVTKDGNLAFGYVRNGLLSFLKVRKEVAGS